MRGSWQVRRAPWWVVFLLAGGLFAETVALVRTRREMEVFSPPVSSPVTKTVEEKSPPPKDSAKEAFPSGSFATRFRETLLHQPTVIAPLVERPSKLGGTWGAYDPDATRFVPPQSFLVEYSDGHEQGVLVLWVEDPERPETWKRLYDDADGSLDSDIEP